jgi:hypothetical protein
MSFLGFHPCPKCNSKDNLGEYTNGFFCFGCGYKKPKRNLSRFNDVKPIKAYDGISLENKLDNEHLKWLLKYNLTDEEMKFFNSCKERTIKGETRKCNLLIFLHTDSYWTGRNFSDGVKYLSSGNKPYFEYGNKGSPQSVLVFTEDVISAVKVSRYATAVPMLGSKVQKEWWENAKKYDRVILWGDRDKARDNVIEARKATELLGKQVEFIIKDKDPKEYNNNELYNYINK